MGKLAVQKYFSFSILILTVLVMIFTLVGLYGGDVQPAGNTARAMLVYALPLLIAANVVLFLYWVIMRRFHWAFIPLIAIMCCIPTQAPSISLVRSMSMPTSSPASRLLPTTWLCSVAKPQALLPRIF